LNLNEADIEKALNDENMIEYAQQHSNELNDKYKYYFKNSNIQKQPTNNTQSPSFEELKSFIYNNEGYSNSVYLDTENKRTIGVGCNLERDIAKQMIEQLGLNYYSVLNGQTKLNDDQISYLFSYDLKSAINDARNFVNNLNSLPKEIQIVIIDMSFNLGNTKLNKFVDFKKAIEAYDYPNASKEMIDSEWYGQTKGRSKRSVNIVQSFF